ncbi:MAG TPA: uroporphyrinogen-III synthase [Terriglobales bacterium]|nr:uroporphyrinogen-III synthase [Terriglobales bacterium]
MTRVIVTRATHQAGGLIEALRAIGTIPMALPTIAVAPPSDFAPLDAALRRLAQFAGVVFTSANAVAGFFDRANQLGLAPEFGSTAWRCAVGPATAEALASRHAPAHIVPDRSDAEGIAAALMTHDLSGREILIPAGSLHRDTLASRLRERGAIIIVVEAYRTLPLAPAALPEAEVIVFTSPSTFNNLVAAVGVESLRGLAIAVIGPTTRQAVTSHGLTVGIEPEAPTTVSLVAAIERFVKHR